MRKILLAAALGLLLSSAPAWSQATNGCTGVALKWTPINKAAASTTLLVAGAAGKQTYVCKLYLRTAAGSLALIEGTGATCGTGTLGIMGGVTGATGQVFTAEGDMALPADTLAWAKTTVAGNSVCLVTSGAGQISGVIVTGQK